MRATPLAAMLVIGNEILSGKTQDANIAFVAQNLAARGIRMAEVRIVPDIEEEIVAGINALRARYDYVFTTGGIGPTHDDITAESIAKAFGLPCIINPEARAILEKYYAGLNLPLTEGRLRMARMPEGAKLIDNPVSGAPGFIIGNVHVMAGVPKIMQAMLTGLKLEGGAPIQSINVECALRESDFADALAEIQNDFPQIDIGSYPHYKPGQPQVTLTLTGTDAEALDAAKKRVEDMVHNITAALKAAG